MRVLLVAHGFPPAASGGTEIYSDGLARALAREGDEVVVLAREADSARPELALRREQRGGVEVRYLNNTYRDVRGFGETYRNPRIRAVCAKELDRLRPDLAHVQHLTHLTTDLVLELRARQIPVVFTLHDFWLICQRGQLLDRQLARCEGPSPAGCAACLPSAGLLGARQRLAHIRELADRVDLFISPSRTVRDRFVRFGVPAERILQLPYGHDHGAFEGLARAGGPPPLRLGFAGSLMVSKAPDLLLRAFAGLPAGSASLELFGAVSDYHGDASYRQALEPLLRQRGVRHVGPLPRAELARALMAVDVLVVPSIWLENAPLVISEAFLAGVPAVAADQGGMAEMVEHEVSGLRFRPGDAEDLRRALLRLIEEPGLLARLRAGIPRVPTMEAHARELRALYVGLVKSERPRLPRLFAVIVNHGTAEQTLAAARALGRSRRAVDGLIVVDNGALDRGRLAGALPAATVLSTEHNLGFAGGCNVGIGEALARGAELVLLVNSDAELEPGCIERLEAALGEPGAGIAGPTLLRPDGRIESAGLSFSVASGRMRELGSGGAALASPPRAADAVSGGVMLIRAELLRAVGPFDEGYFCYFEDIDLCLRAREAGFGVICAPAARATHQGAGTIGRASPARLYYAARNHLKLGARLGWPGRPRQLSIAALNLAHALRQRGRRGPGLVAVFRGIGDHLRRRYGPSRT